jgi:hypothetical protein
MKISALIPSSDQYIQIDDLTKKALKQFDEVIIASKKIKIKKSNIKLVKNGPNRAMEFNRCAKAASGDVLILLHQNTVNLPRNLASDIRKKFTKEFIAGASNIKFDQNHWLLKVVAFLSNNWRMRIRKLPYCDQTIFLRKKLFMEINGFKNMDIFEDTDFLKKFNKGPLLFLNKTITTSSYRFKKHGIYYHTLRNQLLKLLFLLGVTPKKLKKIYE